MPIALPTPNAKQLAQFDSDIPAVKSAQSITRTIEASLRCLKPRTIGAIAQNLRPDMPLLQALAEFQIQADKVLSEIESFSSIATVVEKEENERLKPTFDRAVMRFFELMKRLPAIDRQIADYENQRRAKVNRFTEAGLSLEVAEREAGETTPSALITERDAAQAEHDALDMFIKTKDETHLPAGFTATA